MAVLIAHISDLHLDGTPATTERTVRALDHLRSLPQTPDALLVTGDIADHGALEEYEEAARLLGELPFPVLPCPGNHDDRTALRKGLLGEEGSTAPVNHVRQIGPITVLSCDSTIPGEDPGLLEADTLEWIGATLAALPGDSPALLALHHPPARVHHAGPDSIGLQEPERLAALLDAHPNVVALLAGHAHTGAASTFAGRPLLLAPGITSTLRVPWDGGRHADRTQPSGLALHLLDEEHHLTTHFRVAL